MVLRCIWAVLFSFALAGCANLEEQAPQAATAAFNVSDNGAAGRIEADVAWLADDARQGREAGTAGYDAAAAYVAERMKEIGLKPGGDNGWYQQVPLRAASSKLDAAAMSIASENGKTTEFSHLEGFRIYASRENATTDVTAPAVFVGYGVHAPSEGHDDYAGLDLDGKIVVRFGGAPDFFDSETGAHFGGTGVKSKTEAERGAVGVIGLYTETFEKRAPWAELTDNPERKSMTWIGPDGEPDVSGPGLKVFAVMNPAYSERLFEGAKASYAEVRAAADAEGGAPKGFDLPVTIRLKGASKLEDTQSANVVGIIEGADPALKNEYIILTAHLDHVGVSEKKQNEGEDGIYNGAMDNALGVATMLEVARAFSENGAPARSVILLAVTAEEKGLLGADYFAHFPTVPKEKIVANVNLDMPVMLHDFSDVVAFGAERSTLGPIVAAVTEEAGLTMSPDPFPEQGIFTRSDHYRFVEQGVPAVYLFPGFANGGEEAFGEFMEKHYHEPSDEPSLPIRYDAAARFADVNYLIARAIADAPERPAWNEGDFFGALFAGK